MEKLLFEKVSITYRQEGDYLLPNLAVPESTPVGIWGQRRKRYLREHGMPLYTALLFSGKLDAHIYDRALYNTIRQTLADEGTGNSAGSRCAYTMVSKENYGAVKELLGRMDGYFWYDHYVPQNLTNYYEYLDYFAVSAEISGDYQPALNFIRPVIEQVNGMASDREKVKYLNDYLCGLMSYDKKATAGISQVFTQHSGEIAGACGSYAHNFKFLCGAAGIPCFTISTNNHSWNLVYADGQWLHVDVSANDLYRQDYILLTGTVQNRADTAPAATAFLKELLVPGSTK